MVKKADTQTEWYSYASKRWANAVILVDKNITYNANEVIPEENIESYFVWIPKYSYELFDLGNYTNLDGIEEGKEKPINIRFGTADTSDNNSGECTTPMASGESGNCEVGDYMTHPAFISMNTNGLWVGKFETSGSTSNLTVKPNRISLRSLNVMTMFTTAYNYQRELDSHMMKNTEWGAVAYLTNSIYGTCVGNSCNEVRINNASDYMTGYAAVHAPTTGNTKTNESCTTYPDNCNEYGASTTPLNEAWNTSIGVLASTTANISGIYDMSGGTDEIVMASVADSSGNPLSGYNLNNNSGFSGQNYDGSKTEGLNFPDSKYYDLYKNGNNSGAYNTRILGDATGEMGPFGNIAYKGSPENAATRTTKSSSWYKDGMSMAATSMPWIVCGGHYSYGIESGIFKHDVFYGTTYNSNGFRVVLVD